jgi:TP901 family phage tail tape measure protein
MSKILEEAEIKVTLNGEQAHRKVIELTDTIDGLKRKIKEAEEAGDKMKADGLKKSLRDAEQELKNVQTALRNTNYMLANINSYTPKELQRALKEINRELGSGKIIRGSEEWNYYQAAAKKVKEELAELKDEMTPTGKNFIDELADGFNKWFGFYSIAEDAIGQINSFVNKNVTAYADMEEAMAQVTKYTGMTTEQVRDLNDAFKAMDTRTSREKLNALAGDAGRLGIQSKEAVLEFVDAADKINVSLGDELGDNAVKNIGKLAMMFGEDKTMGLRGAMLATGSAINEVAQNCSASEGFLVDFTARVAAVANQAKISQADILGFAASMDENMLQDETSATAYQKILMKMFTKTSLFANAAGLDLEKFTELLKTDANEAVLQFAEGLSKKGGLADLAPIFGDLKTEGAGVSTVLSVLAGKADEIRARQELANKAYQEGTSIIDEFNVQNNTVQGGLDKAKKRFNDLSVELGEKLSPIMQNGLHLTSKFIVLLTSLLKFVAENREGIIATTAALVVATQTATAWNTVMKAKAAALKLATQLHVLHHAALLRFNGQTQMAANLTAKYADVLVATTAKQKLMIAVTQLSASVTLLLTGRIKEAWTALKAFGSLLVTNPITMWASAIAAAGLAVYGWVSHIRSANKEMKEFSKENLKEQTELQDLVKKIKKANEGTQERKNLIEEFNKRYGEYIGHLLTEKSTVQELAAAYNQAALAIQNKLAQEKMEESTGAVRNKYLDDKADAMQDYSTELNKHVSGKSAETIRAKTIEVVNEGLEKGASRENIQKSLTSALMKQYKIDVGDMTEVSKPLAEYIKAATKEYDEIKAIEDKFGSLVVKTPEVTVEAGGTSSGGTTPVIYTGDEDDDEGETESDKARNKRIQAELKAEKAQYYTELKELQEQYLNDSLMSTEEYNRFAEDLERQHLERQLGIAGLEEDQRAQIQEKIMQAKIKFHQECEKEDANDRKTAEENQKKQQATYLSEQEKQFQLENENQMRKYVDGLISLAEYNESVKQLKANYLKSMSEDEQLSEEQRKNFLNKIHQEEVSELEKSFEKKQSKEEEDKKKQEEYAKSLESMATEYAESLGEMAAEGELTFKSFTRETLLLALDALEKTLQMSMAEITMKNAAASAPLSFIGIAKAAAQNAALAASFAVVKGLVKKNFYTGGYTGSGEWDEPQGIVHSNEFVANRFAVANPQVRPILDLINVAQKQNTIGSLTAADISRVLPGQQTATQGTVSVVQTTDPEMKALLAECRSTIAEMKKRLEEPIFAYTRVSGKYGINEAQKLNQTLTNNASR